MAPGRPAGTRRARPVSCTWATCGPRCWPGCSPGRPGAAFLLRIEDLDPAGSGPGMAERQVADLAALGRRPSTASRWSSRSGPTAYAAALERARRPDLRVLLHPAGDRRGGLGPARRRRPLPGHLPRPDRGRARPSGAGPGRRRCGCGPTGPSRPSSTALHGEVTGVVDDFVVRRNDGVAAYNLAVVVDDAAQGVDQVVRGDDLLPRGASTRPTWPRCSAHRSPTYAHVPLAVNADGRGWPSATARSPWPTWPPRRRRRARCWP